MHEPETPHFNKERRQTDASLNIERGKNDESFKDGRGKAQADTDRSVTNDRHKADVDRLARRSTADRINEKDGALVSQRKSEDAAIVNERTSMDSALGFERAEKARLMDRLLNEERKATDRNLLGERIKSDVETDRATERLKAEQAAHSITKSSLTTREEFVAIVSHDLRNPIGSVKSASQLLLEDHPEIAVGSRAHALVAMINRNSEAALRLISDILDMERIVDGKIALRLQPTCLAGLVTESIETYLHFARDKKISLEAIIPSGPSYTLLCDKDRIAQVLSNLIMNALKFTQEGGSVRVELKSENKHVEIAIADNGPGILAKQIGRIFERFAQLENKDRTGIGLGLYIARTLIESHGGTIDVVSSPAGSTFKFSLPASGSASDGAFHAAGTPENSFA